MRSLFVRNGVAPYNERVGQGSFDEAKKKLKSVSAKVTGIVVNGVGFCVVTVKNLKIGDSGVTHLKCHPCKAM